MALKSTEAPSTEHLTGAATLGALVLAAADRGSAVAMRYRSGTETRTLSYSQLGTISREIARGLISLDVQPGDRVAILCSTRAEWTLADCGSLCAGAVVVPVYHTNSPAECSYVLSHSESKVIFCEDASQVAKIAEIRAQLPRLRHVIVLDGEAPDAITLTQLRKLAGEVAQDAVDERMRTVTADDPATLVYTSGTTGPPKGCLLTHSNLIATSRMYCERLDISAQHSLYQFLPLAHVLARVAQIVILDTGAQIYFWGREPGQIVQELSEMKPTHFAAVPRIYEKIHTAIIGRIQDGSSLQGSLFRRALTQSRAVRRLQDQGERVGLLRTARHRLSDWLVLSKVRLIFGDQLQQALVGAAPVAQELLEFFDACGIRVLEGYGLTESCAAATLNTPASCRMGTVGRPLPGTEVKIAEDGEILLRGPNIFAGYHRNVAATREAILENGWLASGDLGSITDEGYLVVTGRKKDLIITSSGKNVTPVNIENALRDTRWISEAVVYGDRRPYLVAMVTLDPDEQIKLADRLGIPADTAELARDERVHSMIGRDVEDVNANLARIEQIKRFAILDHDLTQESGELTPTLKVKRSVVYDRYAELFANLYRTETPP